MSLIRYVYLATLLLTQGSHVVAAPPIAVATVVDGESFVLRQNSKAALAEGVGLQADDIIETTAQAGMLKLEFDNGVGIAFGPGSRALLTPKLTGDRARGDVYVLTGSVKVTAPKDIGASVLSPSLDFKTTGGVAVMTQTAEATMVFAEAGELPVRRPDASSQTVKAGQLLIVSRRGEAPELASRPTPAFVQSMPRTFMDSVPARAAKFKGKDVEAQRLGPVVYSDAQPWLDAEPALRRAYLPRWRSFARDAEFRRGLVTGIKSHPEWEPILFPPPQAVKAPKPAY